MTEPASIRYKNPSAMWPGRTATKWGSTEWVQLNDGQGNRIAVFPTFVQGAAAAFDLWATNYTGKTLLANIKKWSGGNSYGSYANYLERNSGVSRNQSITREFLASDGGWRLLKWQSHWEAGKAIPMTDAEWQQAQAMVFKNAPQPVTAPYLKMGSTGPDVNKLQQLLNIPVNGTFDPSTRSAVMAYQKAHGLRDDGIVGPLTWRALG